MKPKEVQLSVERVPGTLSTASKSVQVNGAATVSSPPFSQVSSLTGGLQCVERFSDPPFWRRNVHEGNVIYLTVNEQKQTEQNTISLSLKPHFIVLYIEMMKYSY